MKNTIQKIAILSLSLMLISTYSVSCIIPDLMNFFPDRSQESVETLISISSLAISITIVLNIWLAKILSERASIILGSVLLVAGGAGAMLIQSYELMFLSRLLLGFGIGMINARAITMIQCRYQGREQAFLLGLRGSFEVLGNTFLTFLAGRLMLMGWRFAFAIYLFIVPVLVLYLIFVAPSGEDSHAKHEVLRGTEPGAETVKMGKEEILFLVQVFALGWIIINTNSAVTMRIPTLVVEKGFGTAADSSLVLTFMLIVGVVAGTIFERLLRLFSNRLLSVGMLSVGLGMLIIGYSGSMAILVTGVAFCGFSNGFLATVVFHRVAEVLSQETLSYGTYAALLGCNIGAATSPMMLKLVGMIMPGVSGSYIVYGVINAVLAVVLIRWGRKERL